MLVPLMDMKTWKEFHDCWYKHHDCFSTMLDSYTSKPFDDLAHEFDDLAHEFDAVFDIFKDTKCTIIPRELCRTLYFAYTPSCGIRTLNKMPRSDSNTYVYRVDKNTLNVVSYCISMRAYSCAHTMLHAFGDEALKEVAEYSIIPAISQLIPHSSIYGETFSSATLYMLSCLQKKYNELCIHAKYIGRELPDYASRFSTHYGEDLIQTNLTQAGSIKA